MKTPFVPFLERIGPTGRRRLARGMDALRRRFQRRMTRRHPRILINGRRWMLWLWPYLVTRPRWGTQHGTDGRSHSLWLWCLQVWWSNAPALPPQRSGGRQEQIVRRDGYQFCEKHQQEYRQYCSGCACELPAANSPICLTGAKGGGDPDKPPCARAIWPCPTCGAVDMADAGNKCRADWVCAADDQRQADYEAEQAAKGGGE
jgi:hypothetical protein